MFDNVDDLNRGILALKNDNVRTQFLISGSSAENHEAGNQRREFHTSVTSEDWQPLTPTASLVPPSVLVAHDVQKKRNAEVKVTVTMDGFKMSELTEKQKVPLKGNGIISLDPQKICGFEFPDLEKEITEEDCMAWFNQWVNTGYFGAPNGSTKARTTFSLKPARLINLETGETGANNGSDMIYSTTHGYGLLYHKTPKSIQAVFDYAIKTLGVKSIKATITCHSKGSINKGSTGYPLNQDGQRADTNIHFDSYRGVNEMTRAIWGCVFKGLKWWAEESDV